MKVLFSADREIRDHNHVVIDRFLAGSVYDLPTASARRWINRNVAAEYTGDDIPVSDHKVAPGAMALPSVDPLGDKTDASGSPAKGGRVNPLSSSALAPASSDKTSSDAKGEGDQSQSTAPAGSQASQTASTAATPGGGDKPAAKSGQTKKDSKKGSK